MQSAKTEKRFTDQERRELVSCLYKYLQTKWTVNKINKVQLESVCNTAYRLMPVFDRVAMCQFLTNKSKNVKMKLQKKAVRGSQTTESDIVLEEPRHYNESEIKNMVEQLKTMVITDKNIKEAEKLFKETFQYRQKIVANLENSLHVEFDYFFSNTDLVSISVVILCV